MQVTRRTHLLVFEDAIGITKGYRPIWDRLLIRSGITERNTRVTIRSSYQAFDRKQHLEWKKTRKQPGFNTDELMMNRVRRWVEGCIEQHKPDLIVCFDPALLFLLNPDWSQATLDKLRGGLYIEYSIPWIVTLPLTAHHNKAKATDIAKLNQGFIEKGEFNDYKKELDYADLGSESRGDNDSDSDDDEDDALDSDIDDRNDKSLMEWHEPVIIPFGKIMLKYDFEKVGRVLSRIPTELQTYEQVTRLLD